MSAVDGYLQSIQATILFFPLIALFVFVPMRWAHHRRYGELHEFRAFVSYLFVFSIMSAMLLTILPLPSAAQPICDWRERIPVNQYVPLASFIDVFAFKDSHNLEWSRDGLIANKALLQLILNTLLLVPAGFLFRALYRESFQTTIITAVFFSLSLEVTQLTGVWGLANCPYRVFDVDDLITNTAGAMMGWALFGAFHWLPDPSAPENELWYRRRRVKRAGKGRN